MKFCSTFPHIEELELGFIKTPVIDFNLRPLKGLDLMDLPGLSSFISDMIKWGLDTSLVHPVTLKIPVLQYMTVEEGTNKLIPFKLILIIIDKIVGVLTVTAHEARNLKNVEVTGKSDPYAKLLIGGKEVWRTRVIDNKYVVHDLGII